NGFVIINLIGRYLNRWVLLVVMVAGMCTVAYAIHRLIEARLAGRLKRALTRLVGVIQPGPRPPAGPGGPVSGGRRASGSYEGTQSAGLAAR
ncbi:MAG TPA: hypothetical protein VNW50_20210, partial [Streptosporangiaceae bacterium]|nr:hypothetical protein [Streptosporangiaceae bacterium]